MLQMPMHFKVFLSFLIALLISGCANNQTDSNSQNDSVDNLIADKNTESLEFWTADTIIKTNPRLVGLMDSLYQYARNELDNNDIRKNIEWMRNYRNQLCEYYKETCNMDSISEFCMADSIIEEARRLWDIERDESTMGMIISNDTERTRLIFEEFNEYDRLNCIFKTEEQRQLHLKEFENWMKLAQRFNDIYADCVDLHYWDGSMGGPIKSSGANKILLAHIDLYKKEYLIITKSINEWEDSGTFLNPARSLLINCTNQAINEYYCPDERDTRYTKLYDRTKTAIKELPTLIDVWCESRKPLEEEMRTDWLLPEYYRHTAEVLIKMSNTISSIQ